MFFHPCCGVYIYITPPDVRDVGLLVGALVALIVLVVTVYVVARVWEGRRG